MVGMVLKRTLALALGLTAWAMVSTPSMGQIYSVSVVHSFGGGSIPDDGARPDYPPTLASDGNFYGTTSQGGTTAIHGSTGAGVAYKMALDGTLTILHNFADGSVPNDGDDPACPLIEDTNGDLYGTTFVGGVNRSGTVFEMTKAGVVTILHSFGGTGDGFHPIGPLTHAADGTLLGTTRDGGANGTGTVFSITPSGTYTLLHSMNLVLNTNTDGRGPNSGLLDGQDGFFYGTAALGGSNDVGTVFKVKEDGTFSVVHTMTTDEGGGPFYGLALGTDGNFYGVNNGSQAGYGNVFKMTPGGTVTIVHAFSGVGTDGAVPSSTPTIDASGNLYGTFSSGGEFDNGGAYMIDTLGHYSTLTSWTSPNIVLHPQTALDATSDGIYGSFNVGPTGSSGAIFKFAPAVGGSATHLAITPKTQLFGGWDAGVPFDFTVQALDINGTLASGYTGMVHFTSSDPLAILPANAGLTASVGDFSATLYSSASLTATDTVASSITGASSLVVEPVTLVVGVPHTVTAGTPFNFTITATDTNRNSTASEYGETLTFTSNAPRSTLPSSTAVSNGVGTFSATFTTAGSASANLKIHASNSNGAVSGTSPAIIVTPATATDFAVSIPTVVQGGVPFSMTVTAKDPYGNVATNYSGTVHFTSSDGAALLPADTTLINGVGTVNASLSMNGSQTITATDTVHAGVHGTSNMSTVVGAIYLLIVAPSHITSGTPFSLTVTAVDRYGRTAIGYQGTVKFYSNAGNATLPGNTVLVNGTASVSATIAGNSSYKISAVDVADSSLHGTSGLISTGP